MAKQKSLEDLRKELSEKEAELEKIVDCWDEIVDELKLFLKPSAEIKRILTEAGSKAHYTGIGASEEEFQKAIIMARTMRSRYTILDLADDLNILEAFANDKSNLL